MLKMTVVKLGKISDIDIYLFIKKWWRRGISYIAKRHSKANGKYMKYYDPTKPWIYIPYLNMNNLCGCRMSNYLPHGRFKWLKNIDKFDVNSMSENSSTGCIPEVDYQLALEKLAIFYNMLSDYCKKIAVEYGIKVGDVKKIIPNLDSKTN